MKKQNAKISEEETNQDPFLLLGSGMISYRDLLQTFIYLFAFLSILMLPAVYFYGYGGYHGYGALNIGYERYSLGNMGYSSVECMQVPKELTQFPLGCNIGKISHI